MWGAWCGGVGWVWCCCVYSWLLGVCRPCCLVGVVLQCVSVPAVVCLLLCVCPCCLVVMERERMNNKTSIPTQNIIYTTFKGWLYNIANPLQKEKGKLTKYGCFPFIPYAFKISTSTPILINKSSTSLSLLRGFANSTSIFSLLIYVSKSPRIR